MPNGYSRRAFLAASVSGVVLSQTPRPAAARYDVAADPFPYEVQRSEAAWREMLGEEAFEVMRRGATEPPKSHPLWDSTEPGTYSCKGCDLPLFDADWKVVLDLGWLFFRHGHANSNLLGLDRPERRAEDGEVSREVIDALAMVETHCRRCGSHLGHIVAVEGHVLHCINGVSMNFVPAAG